MSTPLLQVRYALRQLGRAPLFTVTVVLTLALGIGANAAIFSVIDAVLLRPLGYRQADRIFAIETRYLQERRVNPRIGGDDYNDVAREVKGLEAAAYYQSGEDGLQVAGRSLYTRTAYVSPRFGQVLGVEPVAGRLLTNSAAAAQEVLVSAGFARENLGGVAQALGQTVRYEGEIHTVVGVLPDGFDFPKRSRVWIGLDPKPATANRTAYNQRALARAAPGVSAEALGAELAGFSKQLGVLYPEDRNKELIAVPLREELVGKVRPMLRLIMGAVGVILLLVCANIGHLQLVRATQAQHQIAVCTALGASRGDLAARALWQAGLLAVLGGAAGLALANPLLHGLLRLAPQDLPRLTDIHLNGDVFAFCFAVSVLVMGATAMLPVWRSWHVDPVTAIKQDGARGLGGERTTALRGLLVAGEVALTFCLSVAALLLVGQMLRLSRQQVGFDADRLAVIDAHATDNPVWPKDGSDPRTVRWNDLIERMEHLPGVDGAAGVMGVPMSGGGHSDVSYAIHGRTEFKAGNSLPDANIISATPGYFRVMGMPLLRGRGLTEQDTPTTAPVLVVSRSMAQQQFPGEDAVGKQIMCGYDEKTSWWTIVGVVEDVLQDSPASKPYPTFYVPLAQHPDRSADETLVVRSHGDPEAMMASLERVMRESHPEIATTAATMRGMMGSSLREERFRTMLFGCFAGISILLAAIGMYGVTAYTVAQRRFEFALRFCFGADRGQVFRMVLSRTGTMAALGLVTGGLLALAATRMLGSVFPGVEMLNVASWLLAALLVVLLTFAATLLPARRASETSPMEALRAD